MWTKLKRIRSGEKLNKKCIQQNFWENSINMWSFLVYNSTVFQYWHSNYEEWNFLWMAVVVAICVFFPSIDYSGLLLLFFGVSMWTNLKRIRSSEKLNNKCIQPNFWAVCYDAQNKTVFFPSKITYLNSFEGWKTLRFWEWFIPLVIIPFLSVQISLIVEWFKKWV